MSDYHCPICNTSLSREEAGSGPYAPFCSQHCRMVDLGKWLGGHYTIPLSAQTDDDDSVAAPHAPIDDQ